MNKPEYVKVNNKKYKINTDFRVAIECTKIATDEEIDDTERALAVIYKLFGDEGLNSKNDWEDLLKVGAKYLNLNRDSTTSAEEPDMDFEQDMDYIEASFMSDYKIDLTETKMHWWKFYNLLEGLSNSELGNCCVLNRIRNLRTFDVSQIKDAKEKNKILRAKEQVALKKEYKMTDEQKENQKKFFELLNGGEADG